MRITAAIIVCIATALGLVGCAAAGFHPDSGPYSPGVYMGAGGLSVAGKAGNYPAKAYS
jgi:hypothetical protein